MVRVTMADGSLREFPANQVGIAADGSLQLNRVEIRQRFDVAAGRQVQEMSNPKLLFILRRDLWREVENLDVADEPVKLEAVN